MSEEVQKPAVIGIPFQKGRPGGPGMGIYQKRLKKLEGRLVKACTPRIMADIANNLLEIASQQEDKQAAIQAFNAIANRYWGKPKQQLDITHHEGMTSDERRQHVAAFFGLPQAAPLPMLEGESVTQSKPPVTPADPNTPPPVICRQIEQESATHPSQPATPNSSQNVNLGEPTPIQGLLTGYVAQQQALAGVVICDEPDCGYECDADWVCCPKCGMILDKPIPHSSDSGASKPSEGIPVVEKAIVAPGASGKPKKPRKTLAERQAEKKAQAKQDRADNVKLEKLKYLRGRKAQVGSMFWQQEKVLIELEAWEKEYLARKAVETGGSAALLQGSEANPPLPDAGCAPDAENSEKAPKPD